MRTLRDLLTHFPRSYIDLSQVETCGTARIGEVCTIRGTVHEIKLKKPRYNLKLVEIALVDGTGILIVTCFRQPWLMDQVKAGGCGGCFWQGDLRLRLQAHDQTSSR